MFIFFLSHTIKIRSTSRQGKYGFLSAAAKGYLEEILKDDSAVYEAAVAKHFEQRKQFSKFDKILERFRGSAALLKKQRE